MKDKKQKNEQNAGAIAAKPKKKKKVLIAASFITPAHLYIWDEPLNYIDVFSRMQIEQLLLSASPTMLVVDHDVRFQKKLATRTVKL